MPFSPTPPIPPQEVRRVIIQLKGPKDTYRIKQLNSELKKIARKYGATFKMGRTSRRAKATRAKARRAKRKR
jgi:hypothetical protein